MGMRENRRLGVISAVTTYLLWGVLPLYWHLLSEAGADEILACRVIWSFLFMLLVIFATKRRGQLRADFLSLLHEKRRLALLAAASAIISLNWLTYIWAVNHGHVIDTSIGYYINPLMSVLLGVAVFGETLSAPKKISIVLASVGILSMTWQLGKLPWVSVALAVTFAAYGAAKKRLGMNPFSGIALETLLLLPFALAYVAAMPETHFGPSRPWLSLLLAGTGVVTAVPLVLFAYGANLLPLNVLGFFQYISPTLALLLGIFFFNEPFGWAQLSAFGFIWAALALFTVSEWAAHRREK